VSATNAAAALAEISAEWEAEDAAASAALHDPTPQAGDTRPRRATDYRGLSTGENDFQRHMSMHGSAGYPIRKIKGGRWIWQPFFGVKGAPVVYKTKREAVAAVEAFLYILRDKSAGRI
jgi:hypothetical protein